MTEVKGIAFVSCIETTMKIEEQCIFSAHSQRASPHLSLNHSKMHSEEQFTKLSSLVELMIWKHYEELLYEVYFAQILNNYCTKYDLAQILGKWK